jgi:predicted hydrocarbon binding protein
VSLPEGPSPPAPDRPAGNIKGVAFREFLVWYARAYGGDALAAAARALPAGPTGSFDPAAETLGVLASKWYPGALVHALMDELVRGRSSDERARMARDGADAVMAATLRGVYRLLFEWIANPERYARYAGKLWRSYYDSGTLEIVETGADSARSVVRQWRTHHPFICELNREASRAIYQAMGCAEVHCERESCVAEGADVCSFVTRWRR